MSHASVHPAGGVKVTVALSAPTPPMSIVPLVVVVTLGSVMVDLVAPPLATVTDVSTGCVVSTPTYRAMPPLHVCAVPRTHVQLVTSASAAVTTW